jgi:nucleoside-diphosphate-sugar epimerase
MTSTVLVSGGSGYIAGFLIRQLVAEGWTVRTTVRSLARESAVRTLLAVDNSRLTFFEADLRIGNSNAPQSPTTRPQPAKTGRLRQ